MKLLKTLFKSAVVYFGACFLIAFIRILVQKKYEEEKQEEEFDDSIFEDE